MREGQYLRLTISRQLEVCLENSNSPPQPVTFIVPPVVGKALSFTGRLPVSVVGVSLEEEIQISEVGRDTPAKLRSVLDWGRQENSTQERRQKICRISKLLGDLSVQLGDFDAGHWHYRNAIRFSSSTDPAIWQSATLVGIGASIYLRQIDVLGKHRFFEVCNSEQCSQRLRPSERLSPILSATGCLAGLDLATTEKHTVRVPKTPSRALFRAIQSLQGLRKASSVPRCVIETAYKSADYLVTAKKRTKAARLLGSLQTDVIPQGCCPPLWRKILLEQ
uniref:TPR_REGION domain-containing protein n=1 Tax=Mesocestoides corti TaxID=53468 RepID=A0A5K3FR10_MESCO